MPRKARVFIASGIYHVCLRSVNQQIIFEDEADYRKFLSILANCKQKYDIDIYAYCLMSNHVHLLLHAEPDNLNRFFRSFGVRFVQWYYNIKYQRTGHLFQDRFYSQPVSNPDQFLTTINYIHTNPVQANMCRFPNEYRWSSCAAYYGKEDSLVNIMLAISIAGSKDALRHFFTTETALADEDLSYIEKLNSTVSCSYTDENALPLFHSITGCKSPSDFQHLPRVERNDYIRKLLEANLTSSQISRFSGVSLSTISRIKSAMK